MLAFIREGSPAARKALWAAWLGWMLDGMDVMLYAMVVPSLMRDLHVSASVAGLLASATLVASAVGGFAFGLLADRFGRVRALVGSILTYSVFTAACGLATNVETLALFRIALGLGMGGEWACGVALVAETWPAAHRGKALGFVQSAWAVGYAAAAVVTALVLPAFGWRAVFFAGVLPALITLWVRRSVPEPRIWREQRTGGDRRAGVAELFAPAHRRHIFITAVLNAAALFAWWGLFNWIPTYLGAPVSAGGAGLSIVSTSTWIVLMQGGMWLGYLTFGFVADRLGRKPAYAGYLTAAAILVPIYGVTRAPALLLLLGPLVAFFGTGHFSGFGAVTAELFPTAIRATAQGFTYNVGRVAAAVAPFAVGSLAGPYGLGFAFFLTAAAFLVAALVALALPETKGQELA